MNSHNNMKEVMGEIHSTNAGVWPYLKFLENVASCCCKESITHPERESTQSVSDAFYQVGSDDKQS